MNSYRTVNQLDPPEAAYIAGLVDGEGTVTLTTMHRGENRRLVVSISNTERNLLEFVQEALGTGQITSKRTYSTLEVMIRDYCGRIGVTIPEQGVLFEQSQKSAAGRK